MFFHMQLLVVFPYVVLPVYRTWGVYLARVFKGKSLSSVNSKVSLTSFFCYFFSMVVLIFQVGSRSVQSLILELEENK